MITSPLKSIVLDLLRQGHLDLAAFYMRELSESERAAVGSLERWSAKDHLAHRTFWHQNLVRKLKADLEDQMVPPLEEGEDQLNDKNFEEHGNQPWTALLAESESVYGELYVLAEQRSEEELTTPQLFASAPGGHPLYTAFLGSSYEHDQEHLAQYFVDSNALPRAIEIREKRASRVLQTVLPAWVKAWFIYNLACFYAKQDRLNEAAARLELAAAFDPKVREWSLSDPDLAALRNLSA